MKAIQTHRKNLERDIEKLVAERVKIDLQLRVLMAMLKASEETSSDRPRDVAGHMLASRDAVTLDEVCEQTGLSNVLASQLMQRLVRDGLAKRVKRGIYARRDRRRS